MRISDWSSDVCSSDLEIGARLVRTDPAQHVVAAEPEQDERRLRLRIAQHIDQALPAGGGGVARNAGILNARDDSILGERGLQLRRKPFLRSELIAGVKAVTEGDHEKSEEHMSELQS